MKWSGIGLHKPWINIFPYYLLVFICNFLRASLLECRVFKNYLMQSFMEMYYVVFKFISHLLLYYSNGSSEVTL